MNLQFLVWNFYIFLNIISSLTCNRYDYCFKAGTRSYKVFSRIINIYYPRSVMCSFILLLTKKYFQKGNWALASVSTQFEIFLILSCFLRSQVWSRWDRSFDKSFSRILQSCCHVLKICYLFGSQLVWQSHDIFIPSSKMGEENFSKKSVVKGQKMLDFKERKPGFKGGSGNFRRIWNIVNLRYNK